MPERDVPAVSGGPQWCRAHGFLGLHIDVCQGSVALIESPDGPGTAGEKPRPRAAGHRANERARVCANNGYFGTGRSGNPDQTVTVKRIERSLRHPDPLTHVQCLGIDSRKRRPTIDDEPDTVMARGDSALTARGTDPRDQGHSARAQVNARQRVRFGAQRYPQPAKSNGKSSAWVARKAHRRGKRVRSRINLSYTVRSRSTDPHGIVADCNPVRRLSQVDLRDRRQFGNRMLNIHRGVVCDRKTAGPYRRNDRYEPSHAGAQATSRQRDTSLCPAMLTHHRREMHTRVVAELPTQPRRGAHNSRLQPQVMSDGRPALLGRFRERDTSTFQCLSSTKILSTASIASSR